MAEDEKEEYRKCLKQNDALWDLHVELDSLLHAQQLSGEIIKTETVVYWLRMLHNIVQDGLQRPRYPFPEKPATD